jgi:hypothetical protein
MTTEERRNHFDKFADALRLLCNDYGVAIVNQDEYGMAIVPFPINVKTPGFFDVYNITPNGVNREEGDSPAQWRDEGYL